MGTEGLNFNQLVFCAACLSPYSPVLSPSFAQSASEIDHSLRAGNSAPTSGSYEDLRRLSGYRIVLDIGSSGFLRLPPAPGIPGGAWT